MAFGADAVYAGIPRFSLRAKENPYNNSSLKEDIEYCHQVGKKIYVTANILPQNRKLQSFKRSIATIAEAGPDGIIMSDPGMIQYVKTEFSRITNSFIGTNKYNKLDVRGILERLWSKTNHSFA